MILDTETFNKVSKLLKVPHTHVVYCGCYGPNAIQFSIENRIGRNAPVSGIVLTIGEDFKIRKIKRLYGCRYIGRGQRIRFPLPIYRARLTDEA